METPAKVLIVDDEERNRKLLRTLLETDGYGTLEASSGRDALALATAESPTVILLDLMMPGMDGFETAKRLKADAATQAIPIAIVTALDDPSARMRALGSGAEELLTKPVDRWDLSARVRSLVKLSRCLALLQAREPSPDNDALGDSLLLLAQIAEHRDAQVGAHLQHIGGLCRELALALGLSAEFAAALNHASPLHDVGNITLPPGLLDQPGPLSAEDWRQVRGHTTQGARLLAMSSLPYAVLGRELALGHHERWDGSGYPQGLRGEAIPLSCRILSVCDHYDVLRRPRPWRAALSHEQAMATLAEGDGRGAPGHYDPDVLRCFLAQAETFAELFSRCRATGGGTP